jgi:hypothetical protein
MKGLRKRSYGAELGEAAWDGVEWAGAVWAGVEVIGVPVGVRAGVTVGDRAWPPRALLRLRPIIILDMDTAITDTDSITDRDRTRERRTTFTPRLRIRDTFAVIPWCRVTVMPQPDTAATTDTEIITAVTGGRVSVPPLSVRPPLAPLLQALLPSGRTLGSRKPYVHTDTTMLASGKPKGEMNFGRH